MAVLVTMRPDGTLLRQVPFRPAEAHVSGMRFIEGLEWISDRDIVVYGSLNPSTVEYAVVDLQAGKEVRSHLVDGYRWAASPDGSHAAYAGYLPHFTPEAERRPQLCFDRPRVRVVCVDQRRSNPLRALPRRHGGAPSLDSWWRR